MKTIIPKNLSLVQPMGKKGYGPLAYIIVGGAIVVGALWLSNSGSSGNALSAVTGGSTVSNQDTVVKVEQVGGSCPTDGDTTVQTLITNPLNTSGTAYYPTSSIYVLDKTSNKIVGTVASGGDGLFDDITVDCGGKYSVVSTRTQNSFSASKMVDVDAEKASAKVWLEAPVLGRLQATGYNEVSRASLYGSSFDPGQNATTAVVLNTSTTFEADAAGLAIALGNSESYDFSFKVNTNTDYTGFDGVKRYALVDAPAGEYEVPIVSLNSATLTDRKGGVASGDASYLSAYEYAFEMPTALSRTQSDFRIRGQTKSTGTIASDIVVRFVAEQYAVSDTGTTIVSSIFDSAGNERSYSQANQFTINIS